VDLMMALQPQVGAFTTMYTIHIDSSQALTDELLIHELAHVWQAETSGSVYMVEALCSQFFGRAYNLTDDDLRKAKGELLNLEREQQAEAVERYYRVKFKGASEASVGVSLSLLEPIALQVFTPQTNFSADLLRRLSRQPLRMSTTPVRRVQPIRRIVEPA
jgi:hypothetical protein